MLEDLNKELRRLADPDRADSSARFFKTGKGEYGEGDKFLGVSTPSSRKVAKKFKDINLQVVQKLLESEFHEERFVALVILADKFEKADKEEKEKIFNLYVDNTVHINSWDLVDISAYKIVGKYLLNKDRKILYSLSGSSSLWERRISIVSTYAFIRKNDFRDALKISQRLLSDQEDLIHKAVGWMLREIGKRDKKKLDMFLKNNYEQMPRTMLRYAIEKHPEEERQRVLKGDFQNNHG